MNYRLIFVLTLIYGCGQDPAGSPTNRALVVDDSNPPAEPGEQGSTEEIILSGGEQSAKLIDSSAKLPDCTEKDVDTLVYVKDINYFFVCRDLRWEPIDIRGKDGLDGKSGKDGINGKNGTNGTNGINGINGEDGEDGKDALITVVVDSQNSILGRPFSTSLVTPEVQTSKGYLLQATETESKGIKQQFTYYGGSSCSGSPYVSRDLLSNVFSDGADRLWFVSHSTNPWVVSLLSRMDTSGYCQNGSYPGTWYSATANNSEITGVPANGFISPFRLSVP